MGCPMKRCWPASLSRLRSGRTCAAGSTIFFPDAHCAPPSSVDSSERTSAIVRFASSILNALSLRGIAGSSSAAAAFAKFSGVGALPRSDRSAIEARHGLCATPPSARRTSRITPSFDRERRGHRNQSKCVTRAVPHLAIGGMKSGRRRREINRGDQFTRQKIGIDFGSIAGKAMEIGERDAALSGWAEDVHDSHRARRAPRTYPTGA